MDETAPQFSIPSFSVPMREKSPNGSVVPGINIVVTSSNQVISDVSTYYIHILI